MMIAPFIEDKIQKIIFPKQALNIDIFYIPGGSQKCTVHITKFEHDFILLFLLYNQFLMNSVDRFTCII